MSSGYIRLQQLLDQMDRLDDQGRGVPFQIRFVTADRNRGTGGEVIELSGVRKCIGKRNGKVVFDTRKKGENKNPGTGDPRHWVNSTRNLLLPNGQIRKVHIRLIVEFNHQKVCY